MSGLERTSTSDMIVACCHMKRGLPVFVSCIDISWTFYQSFHTLLKNGDKIIYCNTTEYYMWLQLNIAFWNKIGQTIMTIPLLDTECQISM